MEKTKKILAKTGKVMLALLGCVLMPILIWIALGVVILQKTKKRQRVEAAPTLGQILEAAALKIK